MHLNINKVYVPNSFNKMKDIFFLLTRRREAHIAVDEHSDQLDNTGSFPRC